MPCGLSWRSKLSCDESSTRNEPRGGPVFLVKTETPSSPAQSPTALFARTGSRSFLQYWLPVALWMLIIFGFSTNAGAPRNTSRIIGPILRWLNPDIADETVYGIQLVVRKGAHFTEYAVLALLCWRARRKPVRDDVRPWNWSEAGMALLVAVLFAASDEWHQSFVPSREGSLRDVLIDSTGATLGLLALWRWGRWRRIW